MNTVFTDNSYPNTTVVSVKNDACFESGSDLGDDVGTPCV